MVIKYVYIIFVKCRNAVASEASRLDLLLLVSVDN